MDDDVVKKMCPADQYRTGVYLGLFAMGGGYEGADRAKCEGFTYVPG